MFATPWAASVWKVLLAGNHSCGKDLCPFKWLTVVKGNCAATSVCGSLVCHHCSSVLREQWSQQLNRKPILCFDSWIRALCSFPFHSTDCWKKRIELRLWLADLDSIPSAMTPILRLKFKVLWTIIWKILTDLATIDERKLCAWWSPFQRKLPIKLKNMFNCWTLIVPCPCPLVNLSPIAVALSERLTTWDRAQTWIKGFESFQAGVGSKSVTKVHSSHRFQFCSRDLCFIEAVFPTPLGSDV